MRLDASALKKFDDLADIRFSSKPDGARAGIVTRSVSRGPERAFVDSRKGVCSREFSICAVKFRDDPQFAIGIAEAPVEHRVTSVKKKPPRVRPLHLALESSTGS